MLGGTVLGWLEHSQQLLAGDQPVPRACMLQEIPKNYVLDSHREPSRPLRTCCFSSAILLGGLSACCSLTSSRAGRELQGADASGGGGHGRASPGCCSCWSHLLALLEENQGRLLENWRKGRWHARGKQEAGGQAEPKSRGVKLREPCQ
ncbi:hypothetical protein P4O66_017614, partial [Electrophorus voltai]